MSFLIVVLSHERPSLLTDQLVSISHLIQEHVDYLKPTCLVQDNSTIYRSDIEQIAMANSFIYRHSGEASQRSNYLSAIRYASSFDNFCLFHDDDLISANENCSFEIPDSPNALFYFRTRLYSSSPNRQLRYSQPIKRLIRTMPGCYFVYPHRFPMFPSIIYPQRAIPIMARIARKDTLFKKVLGPALDVYLILRLVDALDIREFKVLPGIEYLYRTHLGQDSCNIQFNHRINLLAASNKVIPGNPLFRMFFFISSMFFAFYYQYPMLWYISRLIKRLRCSN